MCPKELTQLFFSNDSCFQRILILCYFWNQRKTTKLRRRFDNKEQDFIKSKILNDGHFVDTDFSFSRHSRIFNNVKNVA